MSSPLVFFQLATPDPRGTYAYLDALFGWEPAEPDANGTISIGPGGPADFDVGGTLMPDGDGRQQTTLFFRVVDLWETVERAETLGGRVLMPISQATPDGAHIAIVATPDASLSVGIIQA